MASFIIAATLMAFISTTSAYDHLVGARDGWVPNPKVSFNTWAERTRFQVNDKLVFKYKAGDSVLVVNKQDYDSCSVKSPIQKLEGGNSVFTFDRSGPYYFISGVQGNCANGEKLIVVVLSARGGGNKPTPQPPTVSPPSPISPSLMPPTASPPATSPSISPAANAPATLSPPATSPSISPAANAPATISPGPSAPEFAPGPAPVSSTPGENSSSSSSSSSALACSGVAAAVLMAVVMGRFILG